MEEEAGDHGGCDEGEEDDVDDVDDEADLAEAGELVRLGEDEEGQPARGHDEGVPCPCEVRKPCAEAEFWSWVRVVGLVFHSVLAVTFHLLGQRWRLTLFVDDEPAPPVVLAVEESMVLSELGLSLACQGGNVSNGLPFSFGLERVVGELEGVTHRRAYDGLVAIGAE